MESPARGVRFIHGGIRSEAAGIAEAAATLDPHNGDQVARLKDRLAFLRKVAKTHNDNEEAVIYNALDAKRPQLTVPYRLDHQAADSAIAEAEETLLRLHGAEDRSARAELARLLARQTAALSAITALYIGKEEQHLVPLQEQYFTVEEQAANGGRVVGSFGPQLLVQVMVWLLRMQTVDEREDMLRTLTVMPPAQFAALAGWSKAGLPADEWAELVRRVPQLASV
ncbi:MAG: hemerythrin domain-containing protein [Chloroflexi bacterium]|nr:hemerythrin domain-containing protein [Chloroflexota bacterium]